MISSILASQLGSTEGLKVKSKEGFGSKFYFFVSTQNEEQEKEYKDSSIEIIDDPLDNMLEFLTIFYIKFFNFNLKDQIFKMNYVQITTKVLMS